MVTPEQEQDLAYHFFVHELFHCWIGGNVSNGYEQIVEAITQYMTDWVRSSIWDGVPKIYWFGNGLTGSAS